MCGIVGIYGRSDKKLIKKMNDIIIHRGPNGEGFFEDKNSCSLGHRRLSIIDIEGSPQPMYTADKSKIIIFNGEIYNYQEIRNKLEKKGRIFSTKGDTEVILQSFEEWGEECVERFNGMWAFAIYELETKKLFCSRDRFGVKPFYYTFLDDGTFLFGSEIKSLLCCKEVSKEIDNQEIDNFLTFRYSPTEKTILKNIKKLPPATNAWVEKGKINITRFWSLKFSANKKYSQDVQKEFEEKFSQSIKRRMISEVSVGSFLSGGLDSSYIVAEMDKVSPHAVETFSVGFEEKKYSELSYAEEVAEQYNTTHHELITKSSSFETLKKIVWHLDEPLADAAVLPVYELSHFSSKKVTVILTGEGADELLGGYEKYTKIILGEKFRKNFPSFLGKIFRNFSSNIKWKRMISYFSEKNFSKAYLNLVSVFSREEKMRLYTNNFREKISLQGDAEKIIENITRDEKNTLEKLQQLDIQTWLPNDLLLKGDKITMAASIEQRVPFLDIHFAEYCAGLDSSIKIQKGKVKWILRNALKQFFSEKIFQRKKQGFTVPLEMFREDFEKVLSKENIEKRKIFDWEYVQNLLKKDFYNPFIRRKVFSLVMLEMWFQEFID